MKPRTTTLFCLLAATALASLTQIPLGPLQDFELKTLDLRFRVRDWFREPSARRHAATVVVDDRSLRQLGQGPGLLEAYALALDRAREAGARAIGLRCFLAPADTASAAETAAREKLLEAVRRAPGAVVAAYLPMPGVSPEAEGPAWRRLVGGSQAYPWSAAGPPRLDLHPAEMAWPELALAARRVGHVDVEVDADGVARRLQLVHRAQGGDYPSLVLQLVCDALGVAPAQVRSVPGAILLEGSHRRIPVDGDGRMLVNYRKRARTEIPLGDLVRAPERAGALRGRVVILGATARSQGDFRPTPRDRHVPEVEILAEAAETILAGRFVRRVAWPVQLGLTWLFLAAGACLMVRQSSGRAILTGLGLMGVYILVEKAAFLAAGVWLDFIGPMAAMQAAVIGFPLYGYTLRSRALLDEMGQVRRFEDMVLHFMTSGLVAADGDGRVLRANARAADLLGRPGQALEGRMLREIFAPSPQALEFLDRAVPQPVAPGEGPACTLQPLRVPVVFPGGDDIGDIILDLSVNVSDAMVLAPDQRDTRCYVLTFSDVTEQVRLAAEDERRARLAAIGEIAAKLGHEIRNALGGLRLYIENVREELDPRGAGARAVDHMVDEIASLHRKIEDLREYARDPVLDLADVDLKALLDEALAFTRGDVKAKQIQVTFEATPRLPPLRADRRQIREAFLNLLHNAIEAAPVGGHVRVVLERQVAANGAGSPGSYIVQFEDDGPGVPAEIGEQIFALFFTTKPDVGTGLGLPIVKKVVESHGGRVAFRSRPGQTCFTIVLPPGRRGEGTT